jgi:hypothetical protein
MARTEPRGGQILDASITDADFSSSSQLTVPKGGTGAATLTGILKGNGTSAVTAVTAPSGTIVGTTDTQTLTGKTLTAPKIDTINDTNGRIVLDTSNVGGSASANNYIYVKNATDGNPPTFGSWGTNDANVNITFVPKGTGTFGYFQDTGSNGGITVGGNATNVDFNIATKGTGVVKANNVEVATISGTQTLTNKRITPRVSTLSNITSVSVNSDSFDYVLDTGITGAITLNNPTGTPTEGQKLWYALTGTASRAISYGTAFEDSSLVRPTTTSGTSRIDIGFVWNGATSKWRHVGYC